MGDTADTQLIMLWPPDRRPPAVALPPDYDIRPYRPGDEPRFCTVMALSGWPGWSAKTLQPWQERIPPDSWLMVTERATGTIAATAMGLDDPTAWHPHGGEVGWVASDPLHRGRGLGAAITAAVTARLLALGYTQIHLYTEDFRLPALKSYLRVGFVPYLYADDMAERWRQVCHAVRWPFTPDQWAERPDPTESWQGPTPKGPG